jgi:hypothetical protein
MASLLFLDFDEQLLYYLRRVDPYQPAKEAPALPQNSTLRRIPEPLHA